MRKPVENFRGIEFVRISSLSQEQQQQVWASFDQEKIIKIMKDQALMNDCILYTDFVKWEASNISLVPKSQPKPAPVQHELRKLAFE